MYDKGLERGDRPEGDWIRCEVEWKNESALLVAKYIQQAGIEAVAGLLAAVIDFKDPDDKTQRRAGRRTAEWWSNFLGGVQKVRLCMATPQVTLERAVGWLRKQIAPTLAAVLEAYGGDLAVIHDLIDEGVRRQRSKHRFLAALSV
jgi:phage replication initiation protein